jgi:N-methylhydantoinase A/oxoprolinase/acetone carboxylase beta subunit
VETPVHAWEALAPGTTLPGPCIVESDETTVAVPPWATARVGDYGQVVIRGSADDSGAVA